MITWNTQTHKNAIKLNVIQCVSPEKAVLPGVLFSATFQ